MEDEKAAAYFDDLTKRGEGAARFKQGLGYSAGSSSSPSFVKSSGSFSLSNFVSASTRETDADIERECRIERIQNKLKRKDSTSDKGRGFAERQRRPSSRDSDVRDFGESRRQRRRSRSRSYSSEEDNGRGRSDRRHSSSYRASEDRRRERERGRSRSKSYSPEGRSSRHRSDTRRKNDSSEFYRTTRDDFDSRGGRRRSRSSSPREKKRSESRKVGKADVDCSRLIEGYDKMTPAERVKAKMRLQLSQTVTKDSKKGMSKEWERFDFNKDAPLDDENFEASAEDDDSGLLKDVGRNFRFSAVAANREADIQAAHDEAIFGVPTAAPALEGEARGISSSISEEDRDMNVLQDEENKSNLSSVMNEKVLALQGGSWRDRARKLQNR